LAKALIRGGHEVLALRRTATNLWRLETEKNLIKWFNQETESLELPFQSVDNIDAVIHTATCYGRKKETTSQILEANLLFPIRLFEIASRFNCRAFFNTDTSLCPNLNSYSRSKGQFLEWLERLSGHTKVLNFKFEHMYGAHDDDSKFTSYIFRSCLENKPWIDLTAGDQKRDFIHIDDAVGAYLHLLTRFSGVAGSFNSFDVGSGSAVTIKEFVQTAHRLANSTSELRFGAIPCRENEVMFSEAEISGLRRLGWNPTISLAEGIRSVLAQEKGGKP